MTELEPAPKLTLYFPADFPVKNLAGQSVELDMAGKGGDHYWILGRSPDTTICINHERVSARHCAINYSSLLKRWKLVDLNSSNGTWFKRTRLVPEDPIPVEPGDNFYLANRLLTIAVVENAQDTYRQEEEAEAETSTTIVGSGSGSKTFADVLYAVVTWAFRAKTKVGTVLRLLSVGAGTAVTIILIEALKD